MTESSLALDQESKRYPLSFTQEWFITLDQGDDGGAFGRRFFMVCPIRITGSVDLAVLQGALDDVVARHELLRTLVVRDADPPYQMVCPPHLHQLVERGRRLVQYRDPLRRQQPGEFRSGPTDQVRNHDQPAPRRQRPSHLPHREIKRARMEQRPHIT
jgi:hypothetical protein